jgi:DNA repair exonuclease SbcCD ATPase subunit
MLHFRGFKHVAEFNDLIRKTSFIHNNRFNFIKYLNYEKSIINENTLKMKSDIEKMVSAKVLKAKIDDSDAAIIGFNNDFNNFKTLYNKYVFELESVYSKNLKCLEIDLNSLLTTLNTNILINLKRDNASVDFSLSILGHELHMSALSGFQAFILDLCFRLSAYKNSTVLLPDLMIIDEGFGSSDFNNLQLLSELKVFIDLNFSDKSIIFISHQTLGIESSNLILN